VLLRKPPVLLSFLYLFMWLWAFRISWLIDTRLYPVNRTTLVIDSK
jgi:hypothetical protein